MEADASGPRFFRSFYGAALLLVLAAIVTWRSVDPTEAQPPVVRHAFTIRPAAPVAQRLGPTTAPASIRQDDRLIYFVVSDPDEQERVSDALSCNNCPTSINATGYVAMVHSPQEKAVLLRTVSELNSIRRGLSLTPITVVDLAEY